MAAVLYLPRTTWGSEKIRSTIEGALNNQFAGRVSIGRIELPVFTRATVHDVTITDSAGKPFLKVPLIKAHWSLGDLWARRVILDDVRAERAQIVLDRQPGKRWNWDAILFPDTTKKPRNPKPQFGDWVELRNVTLIDARLEARSPYAVEAWRHERQRDSLLELALAGKLRPVVISVPGGQQRVTVLEHVTIQAPYARIKYPGERTQKFEIASGSAIVKPFHPPALDLRNVSGTVFVDSDSVWFRSVAARLPKSRASMEGSYNITSGNTRLMAQAPDVLTDDWLWLVPTLPKGGAGHINDVRYVLNGTSSDIRLADLSLALETARLDGTADFGFDKDDTRFNDMNLRIANLDTRTLARAMPDVELPRSGVLNGTLVAKGPLEGSTIDGNFRFADSEAGPLAVRMRGVAGFSRGALETRNLRLDIAPAPVTLASVALQPLGGRIGGVVTVSGRTDGWLDTRLALAHDVAGLQSRITGTARVNIAGVEPRVDARLAFAPLNLRAMGRFAPALDLRGNATGTLTLRGVASDMAINSAIRVDTAGGLKVVGRFGVPERGPSFANVLLTADSLDLQRLVPSALKTTLVGIAHVNMRGTTVEDLDGTMVVDLRASNVDRVRVDTVAIVAEAHDGLVTLDTLLLRIGGTQGGGAGTFGLRKDRTGTLAVAIEVDSLQRLRPYLPGDTTQIALTQAAIMRSLKRQRADSVALARRTEVERAARGLAPLALRVTAPAPVRGDSLAGRMMLRLSLRGWLHDISGSGSVEGTNLFVSGNSVQRLSLTPTWDHLLTDSSTARLTGDADAISASGYNVDSLRIAAGYTWRRNTLATGTGDLNIDVHLIDSTGIAMRGALVLDSAQYQARVDSTALVLRSSRWSSPYPWRASWSKGKLQVDSLALEALGSDARLQVDAAVDTAGSTNVTLAIRNTQLWDLADLAQTVSPVDGRVSADLYVDGPAASPKISFLGAVRDVVYDSLPLPEFRARMTYADRKAVAYAEVRRVGQQPNARADATIPVNLALSGNPKRLLELPMTADIQLDSLPLDIIPQLSEAITNVKGETVGRVQVRGTLPDKLRFDGTMRLRNGEAYVVDAELPLRDMVADMQFKGDSLVVDSVRVRSGDGTIRINGGVSLAKLTDPVFDLALVARNARVLDGRKGRIRVLADMTMKGPYTATTVEGSVRVREGVYRIQEERQATEVLSANDPAVLGAVDSTQAFERGLVAPPSDFVRGLKTQVVARIDRDVWVRSDEANVEIFTDGELAVALNPATGGVTLDGIVATERGQYEFLGKRFNIVRGSATFVGTSDLNPLLQAIAEVQVRQASQQALAIRLNIGGTLLRPRLSLESDAQPPIPQTDLISYLAFGNSSGSLLSSGGSGNSSATSGGSLVGSTAAAVNRYFSATALGALLNGAEGNLARVLRADVLNITANGTAPEVQNLFTGFRGFLLATELEYGRYFGTRSYTAVTLTPANFAPTQGNISPIGVRWEYRLPRNYRLETTFGPRFLLTSQTLDLNAPNAFQNIGLFLSREWKW
ncbi:MAG: translocation/assembly module TamB domain-containing protein [Gemmatimonadaceae bacterium]|nr:translocation/assembly module TamB domain-containing protein [Gemmatimonadaceae bacterium]